MSDPVLLNHLSAATMVDVASGYGLIEDAGIALENGRIRWVGRMQDCPAYITKLPTHDCGGLSHLDIMLAQQIDLQL